MPLLDILLRIFDDISHIQNTGKTLRTRVFIVNFFFNWFFLELNLQIDVVISKWR